MTERSGYEHGTPSWVDLASADPDAAASFYSGLFGWEPVEPGPVEETGGYRIFTMNGKNVAGLGPKQDPAQPTVWTTYVTVDDADATAAAAREAGGQVVMEPMDVMSAGRMAYLADTVGAHFAIWQPRDHIGAELVNEPGALCWNELAARDIEAPKPFYGALFGWEGETDELPNGTVYTQWKLGGEAIGGMIQMSDEWPPEIPSHWMSYFAVADTDATAAKATELGGVVSVEPTDIPPGRFAVLNDPEGAVFSVIAMAPQPAEPEKAEATE